MMMFKTYTTNTNPHVGSNTKSGFGRRKNRIMLLKNSSSSLLFGRSTTTKLASFCALSKSFSDVGNGGSFDRRFLRRRLHRRRKSDSSWFSLNSLASGALVPQKKTMDACDEMKSRANNNNTCLLYTSPSPRDLSTSRMPSSA